MLFGGEDVVVGREFVDGFVEEAEIGADLGEVFANRLELLDAT